MKKGVGSDEVKQRPEVSPQPYCYRGYKIGQYLSVGDRDAMLSPLKPDLECVPRFEVRSCVAWFFCQCCHYGPGLLLGIGYGKREEASLIFRMEFDCCGGDKQSGGTLSFYEAWPQSLGGLLDKLVADAALGEKRAYDVGREVA